MDLTPTATEAHVGSTAVSSPCGISLVCSTASVGGSPVIDFGRSKHSLHVMNVRISPGIESGRRSVVVHVDFSLQNSTRIAPHDLKYTREEEASSGTTTHTTLTSETAAGCGRLL